MKNYAIINHHAREISNLSLMILAHRKTEYESRRCHHFEELVNCSDVNVGEFEPPLRRAVMAHHANEIANAALLLQYSPDNEEFLEHFNKHLAKLCEAFGQKIIGDTE